MGSLPHQGKPNLTVLEGHFDPNYRGYDLSYKDVDREAAWEKDFDALVAANSVPRFNTLRFSNDHTSGMRIGAPTPQAAVADNDLALGRFVEHLSKSPIWKESVVFVVEDDAQNGPDHVDAHRSVALVIGPHVKRTLCGSHHVQYHLAAAHDGADSGAAPHEPVRCRCYAALAQLHRQS